MRRLHSILTLLFGTALLLTFPACDSDSDDGGGGDVGSGEFGVTFEGDLSGSFDGNAYFAVAEDDEIPGGRGFVLFMTDSDLTSGATGFGEYIWFVRLGDRPGEGSYSIMNVENENDTEGSLYALYSSVASSTSGVSLGSQTGTLTITSSSSDRVRGSFSFQGSGFSLESQEEITATINGTFDATNLGNGLIPIFQP